MAKPRRSEQRAITDVERRRYLGFIAFRAYFIATLGRTHDGKPMPSWEALGEHIKEGWIAAAADVRSALKDERSR